MQISSRISRV